MAHELNPEYRKKLIEHTARGEGIQPHAAPYGTAMGWDPMTYDYKEKKPMAGAVQIQRPIQGPPHWTQIWPTYADTGVAHQRYTSVADPLTADDLAYLQTAHVGSLGIIRFNKLLCTGAFGGVWSVESHNWFGRTRQMACKVIPFKDIGKYNEERVLVVMGDMHVLQALPPHPNIVGCVDVVGIPDPQTGFPYSVVCIFTELCDGDVFNVLKEPANEKGMPEAMVIEWLRPMASALRFLHSDQRMVHLDVKPQNMLYKWSPGKQRRAYKLCDFGSALQFPIGTDMFVVWQRVLGTRNYNAPECYEPSCWVTPCDIYALGVSLVECLLGLSVYDQMDRQTIVKLFQAVARRMRVPLKNTISPSMAALVASMLADEARHRPTIQQLIANPLLQ